MKVLLSSLAFISLLLRSASAQWAPSLQVGQQVCVEGYVMVRRSTKDIFIKSTSAPN